jgi:hypothetical protein
LRKNCIFSKFVLKLCISELKILLLYNITKFQETQTFSHFRQISI